MSQLILRIHINPSIIDQTFLFFHPELSYLKKLVRLPSIIACREQAITATLNPDQIGEVTRVGGQVWTRVSDSGVLVESGCVNAGESAELLVKVSIGNCPQVLIMTRLQMPEKISRKLFDKQVLLNFRKQNQ